MDFFPLFTHVPIRRCRRWRRGPAPRPAPGGRWAESPGSVPGRPPCMGRNIGSRPFSRCHGNHTRRVRVRCGVTTEFSWHEHSFMCSAPIARSVAQTTKFTMRATVEWPNGICVTDLAIGARWSPVFLPRCRHRASRTWPHCGKSESTHAAKLVSVQPYNSFLDQRSRKIIVWFHRNHFYSVGEPLHNVAKTRQRWTKNTTWTFGAKQSELDFQVEYQPLAAYLASIALHVRWEASLSKISVTGVGVG